MTRSLDSNFKDGSLCSLGSKPLSAQPRAFFSQDVSCTRITSGVCYEIPNPGPSDRAFRRGIFGKFGGSQINGVIPRTLRSQKRLRSGQEWSVTGEKRDGEDGKILCSSSRLQEALFRVLTTTARTGILQRRNFGQWELHREAEAGYG